MTKVIAYYNFQVIYLPIQRHFPLIVLNACIAFHIICLCFINNLFNVIWDCQSNKISVNQTALSTAEAAEVALDAFTLLNYNNNVAFLLYKYELLGKMHRSATFKYESKPPVDGSKRYWYIYIYIL